MFAFLLVLISSFIHAGWTLIVRAQRTSYTILRINLVVAVVGLGPALAAEFWGAPFPPAVWGYLLLTAIFQAGYYLGLSMGYQSGYFSTVYPIARALPIMILAVSDVVRGNAPSALAWLGMALVSGGCLVIPLESLRSFNLDYYRNRTMIWIFIAALGTTGYTLIDKAAAELMEPGPLAAARYGVLEFSFSVPVYWLILKGLGQPTGSPDGWRGWTWPALGAAGVFGSYWLILWSYPLLPQASYIVALRQFSIVIGVVVAVFMFY
jgi:drug/metabolite transporter (DMT)-like permease